MELTKNDYISIAYQVYSTSEETGHVEYTNSNNITVEFDFELYTEGYTEDDYNSGTGAYVCTDVDFHITSAVEIYDEEGNNVNCDFDEALLTKEVEYYCMS